MMRSPPFVLARVTSRPGGLGRVGLWAGLCVLAWSMAPASGAVLNDWRYRQRLLVPAPGLCRVSPTLETFDVSQPGLADMRLIDPAGNEVPFVIDRSRPAGRSVRAVPDLQVTVEEQRTRVQFPLTNGVRVYGISLETPVSSFVKAVTVEGASADGAFRTLLDRQPIFRQGGVSRTFLRLGSALADMQRVRMTINDSRSQPLPLSGVFLHEDDAPSRPPIPTPAVILDRKEGPGETRLTLDLGAAHLPVAGLQLETSEPLFNRRVNVLARELVKGELRERLLGGGTLFRMALDGQATVEQLELPLEFETGREITLSLVNGDSPALPVTAVRFLRPVTDVVFLSRQAGEHALFTGNGRVGPPIYDLTALASSLRRLDGLRLELGPREASSDFHPSEPLPEVPIFGAAMDPAGWNFRRVVKVVGAGVQRLELPPHALAQAQPGFGDVRLIAAGKQVLYLLERSGFSRALPTDAARVEVKDRPRLSRWRILLPQPRLPVARLRCEARSSLFERKVRVFEEIADRNGGRYERVLGSANWVRTPSNKPGPLEVMLEGVPNGETVFLETDNGDNAALELDAFQFFLPVVQLLFQAPAGAAVELCYGNPQAAPPRYDLSLMAPQVLAAATAEATVTGEERLTSAGRPGGPLPVSTIFYVVLALVVGGLIFIITRLLPRRAGS